ncbi:MAG TPA: cytidylate kinase-like family protein [Marinilabiliaceae bacterium]|nr:cytidylate kinase-like family protein [Marinilabiliaceae bacterium]
MENLFLKYMLEQDKRRSLKKKLDFSGPVITISREHGCPATHIAESLSEALTKRNIIIGKDLPWKWISKEIIEESAKELRLSPDLTKDLTDYKARGFFENLALFFSDEFYPSDAKIRNTIAKFIYGAAHKGNVVIVGRAAESITKNFEHAIHIKLTAPLEWRVNEIVKNTGLNPNDARKQAIDMDKRREQFRRYFEKDREDIEFFDTFFNCASMSEEEIIEMIIILAEIRGFV